MAIKKSIPLAAMERILKRAGADRVSEESKEALRDVIENQATEIASSAITLARHAKRKTVKAEDITLASK